MHFAQYVQHGGPGAYAALAFGTLALPVAVFAVVAVLNKSRSAFTLGIVTTLLGFTGAVCGMLGTIYGRIHAQQVVMSYESAVTVERLTRAGWNEAANASMFGFFAVLIPFVVGTFTATSGAKDGRRVLPVVLLTLSALTISGAWGFWHQPPPHGRFEFADDDMNAWQFAFALESIERGRDQACFRLAESLETYWNPTDRNEWPRVIRVPIPERISEVWRPAAKRCMGDILSSIQSPEGQEHRLEALLTSSLLHDDAQRAQLLDWLR